MGRHLHILTIAAGAALLALGVGIDSDVTITDVPILLGIVGLLVGLDMLLGRHTRALPPADDGDARYELGYHDGHRVGYDEGRRVGRPSVVALPVEKLCKNNVGQRGRHAARCRDDCAADRPAGGVRVGSAQWTEDGAS